MEFVTLINRSSKTLMGTWDGRHHEITPGKHSFPEIQALKFRDQHPIMGTENPMTLQKQYLIGIVELGDDVSPIEQSDSVALEDLRDKIASGELKLVRGNGLFSQRDVTPSPFASTGGPVETTFVKP